LVHQADYPSSSEEAQATETTDKPAKAKRIKHSSSHKARQPRSSPKSVGTSEAKEVPAEEPQSENEEESEKVVLEAEEGGQDEGQAGPDPNAQSEDQTVRCWCSS
nr:hypothetical protein [Tanacetum cinerariifolium]